MELEPDNEKNDYFDKAHKLYTITNKIVAVWWPLASLYVPNLQAKPTEFNKIIRVRTTHYNEMKRSLINRELRPENLPELKYFSNEIH